MTQILKWIIGAVAFITTAGASPAPSASRVKDESLGLQKVIVGDGVELHYIERGTGVPAVFVHGSLGDGESWKEQLGPLAASGYRAIA